MALLMTTMPLNGVANENAYWNFNQVNIRTLIQTVAEETGKNFVVDPRVQGDVTVISYKPLNKKEAYQVFLSILHVHGFNAVPSGKVIKIVPLNKSKTEGTPSFRFAEGLDQVAIKVLPLKNVSATEILNSLKPLVPKTSHIFAYGETNHIIVADTISNIKRLEAILQTLDQAPEEYVDVINVEFASALDIIETLKEFITNKRNDPNPIRFAADERTNSILLSGGTTGNRVTLKELIRKLDSHTNNNYNSEVVYLKYVKARNIAPIIGTFLSDAIKSSEEQKYRKDADTESTRRDTQAPIAPSAQAPLNHLRGLRDFEDTEGVQGQLFGQNENQPQSGVINRFVQWEELTNSLIIKAPPTLMRAVKNIITKLDIRRPQVLIDVIIAELTMDRSAELGVEWNPSQNASVKFGTRFPDATNAANGIVGNFLGGAVDTLGSGLSVGIFRHGSIRTLIRALSADSSANILSTPTLVTLDNQTALIKVGEKVPFAIGQTNNDDIGGNPFTSFDREEVGLSLTIRPQITRSGAVKLEIENILSNIKDNSNNPQAGGNPTTTERTIVTNVVVDNNKILVLGGLIQDDWQDVRTGVPILDSIPYVKKLFSKQRKQLMKKNLVIFLRPVIMDDELKNIEVSNKRYEDLRKKQLLNYHNLDRPFIDEPITAKPLSKAEHYPSYLEPKEGDSNPAPGLVLPPPFEKLVDSAFDSRPNYHYPLQNE